MFDWFGSYIIEMGGKAKMKIKIQKALGESAK